MKTIDFLPEIYRQREALRRARLWWGIVVVIFSTAIGASALAQAWLRRGLYQQLDALAPEYAAAQTQVQDLAGMQVQIMRAGHEASLYTFLESPWPRTQLLAEIVAPLPEAVRLTQIHLAEEELARTAIRAGPRNMKAEEEAAARATGPEKDLAKLQEETDRRQTTIEVNGTTADVSRLHDYVADIGRSPLVAAASLKSLETAAGGQRSQTRFTLRILVRPGYCQRSEPAATTAASAAAEQRGAGGGGG
jgi:Tfp pilus assembly protein PilN